MVTSRGGGSSGTRSTSGTWRRFSRILRQTAVNIHKYARMRSRLHREISQLASRVSRDSKRQRPLDSSLRSKSAPIATDSRVAAHLGFPTASMLLFLFLGLFGLPMRLVDLGVHLARLWLVPKISSAKSKVQMQAQKSHNSTNPSFLSPIPLQSSRNFWAGDPRPQAISISIR